MGMYILGVVIVLLSCASVADALCQFKKEVQRIEKMFDYIYSTTTATNYWVRCLKFGEVKDNDADETERDIV